MTNDEWIEALEADGLTQAARIDELEAANATLQTALDLAHTTLIALSGTAYEKP